MVHKKTSRRKPRSRGAIYGAAGAQLYKDVKLLKSLINAEYKTFNYEWDSGDIIALSSTGLYVTSSLANLHPSILPTTLSQGTDAHTREGNSVKIKQISIVGSIKVAAGVQGVCRLVIYMDKNNLYGGVQDYTAIYEQAALAENSPYMFKEKATANTTRILYDKTFYVKAEPTLVQLIPLKIKLKPDSHMKWDDAGNATQNVVRMCGMSDQASVSNIQLRYNCRVSYVDN